jgi:hypothetical protein
MNENDFSKKAEALRRALELQNFDSATKENYTIALIAFRHRLDSSVSFQARYAVPRVPRALTCI